MALLQYWINFSIYFPAFDPAQPGFEGNPSEVRLTKNDAKFVDVIHTNIRPVIPLLGFGLILPTGKTSLSYRYSNYSFITYYIIISTLKKIIQAILIITWTVELYNRDVSHHLFTKLILQVSQILAKSQ